MTGYFARLATRTGVGGKTPSPAQDEATPSLAVEDTVTFVAQPERTASIAANPLPPAAATARLFTSASPAAVPARVTASVPAAPASTPGLDQSQPHADADAPEVRLQHTYANPAAPSTEVLIASPERLQPDLSRPPGAAETRIVRASVAVPAYPAEAASFPIVAREPARADASVAWPESVLQPEPARPGRVANAVVPRPHAAVPSFTSIRIDRPEFAVPREPAPSPANGHMPQRTPQGSSVRIGSIQVDVHAAPERPVPPPPRNSPPAPPAPQPPRIPSLRRFYLRDW